MSCWKNSANRAICIDSILLTCYSKVCVNINGEEAPRSTFASKIEYIEGE